MQPLQIRKFTYTSMKISDFKVKRLITLFDEIEKQAGILHNPTANKNRLTTLMIASRCIFIIV